MNVQSKESFTKKSSSEQRQTETLNRMHILDDQINKASAELLSVEKKKF